jgi:hypothetical protein
MTAHNDETVRIFETYGCGISVSFDNASDAQRCLSEVSRLAGVEAKLDRVLRGYHNYELTGKVEDGHGVSIFTPKAGQKIKRVWPGNSAPNGQKDLLNSQGSELDQQIVAIIEGNFPETVQHLRVSICDEAVVNKEGWLRGTLKANTCAYSFRSPNKIAYDDSYNLRASAHAIAEMEKNPEMHGMKRGVM